MKPDFLYFKDSMLVFGVFSLISMIAVGFAYHVDSRMNEKKMELRRSVQNLKNQLQRHVDEERIVKQKKQEFLDLLAAKRFEPADRMGWIDAAKYRSKEMKLPSLKYTLNSREKLTDDALPPLDDIAIYVTPINIQLGMVHEGDLISMLDYIGRVSSGRLSVEKCHITQLAKSGAFLPTAANIEASCSLSWFNFDKPMVEESSDFAMLPQ